MGIKTAEALENGRRLMDAQSLAGIHTFDPGGQTEALVTVYDNDGEPIVGVVDGVTCVGSENILIAWSRMMMVAAGTVIKNRFLHRIYIKWKNPMIIGD